MTVFNAPSSGCPSGVKIHGPRFFLKLKVMPTSPEVDLEKLKPELESKLKEVGALNITKIEEQDIAFGLKALILTLVWPEEKETEDALDAVKQVENVSSADIIDYRRSFG